MNKFKFKGFEIQTNEDTKRQSKANNKQLLDIMTLKDLLDQFSKVQMQYKSNKKAFDQCKQQAGKGLSMLRKDLHDDVSYPKKGRPKVLYYKKYKIKYDNKKLYKQVDTRIVRNKEETIQSEFPVYEQVKISGEFNLTPTNNLLQLNEYITSLRTKIHTHRELQRNPTITTKDVVIAGTSVPIRKMGSTMVISNTFIDLLEVRHYRKCLEKKVPPTSDGQVYMGIELELFSKVSREDLCREFARAKLYNYVNIGTDGSLRLDKHTEGYHALEIRIMCLEKEHRDILKRITDVLNSPTVSAKVNQSCGLHVHLDMRSISKNKDLIHQNLVNTQAILYSLVPKSRRDNQYCRHTAESRFSHVEGNHHLGVNTKDAYGKHKTFEIRIHSGTTNLLKINNWIELLNSIANNTKPMPVCKNLDDLQNNLDKPLRPELIDYITKRVIEVSKE